MMDARRNGLVLLALLLLTQTTISAQTDSMGKDVPVDSVSVATSDSLQTKRSFLIILMTPIRKRKIKSSISV